MDTSSHSFRVTYEWSYSNLMGFPWAIVVKKRPTNARDVSDTWVQSLRQEDPLEKGMATHSSILAWRFPWREVFGWLQSMGLQGVGYDLSDLACRHVNLICLTVLETVK